MFTPGAVVDVEPDPVAGAGDVPADGAVWALEPELTHPHELLCPAARLPEAALLAPGDGLLGVDLVEHAVEAAQAIRRDRGPGACGVQPGAHLSAVGQLDDVELVQELVRRHLEVGHLHQVHNGEEPGSADASDVGRVHGAGRKPEQLPRRDHLVDEVHGVVGFVVVPGSQAVGSVHAQPVQEPDFLLLGVVRFDVVEDRLSQRAVAQRFDAVRDLLDERARIEPRKAAYLGLQPRSGLFPPHVERAVFRLVAHIELTSIEVEVVERAHPLHVGVGDPPADLLNVPFAQRRVEQCVERIDEF